MYSDKLNAFPFIGFASCFGIVRKNKRKTANKSKLEDKNMIKKENWTLLKKAVIKRKSSEECDDTQLLEKIEDVEILRAYIKCMWDAFENMERDEHHVEDIETLEEKVKKTNEIEAKYCDYIAESMDLDWFD